MYFGGEYCYLCSSVCMYDVSDSSSKPLKASDLFETLGCPVCRHILGIYDLSLVLLIFLPLILFSVRSRNADQFLLF